MVLHTLRFLAASLMIPGVLLLVWRGNGYGVGGKQFLARLIGVEIDILYCVLHEQTCGRKSD